MGFSEEFFHSVYSDLITLIPRVRVRYREQLCFSGKKIEYTDFTKFVKRDDSYYPMFGLKEQSSNDVLVDMYPLINVGVAEIVERLYNMTGLPLLSYLDYVRSKIEFENPKVASNLMTRFERSVEDETSILLTLTSLRSSYCSHNFSTVRQIVTALHVLREANPKAYCEVLLETMTICYPTCSMFINSTDELAYMSSVSENKWGRFRKEFYSIKSVECKRIGYTIPDKNTKHYITDVRGVGIYSFLYLLFIIYRDFGEALSSDSISIGENKPMYIDRIQDKLVGCIGDDFIGKYIKRGKVRIRACSSDHVDFYMGVGVRPVDCYEVYPLKLNNSDLDISRQMYDDRKLFSRAMGCSILKSDDCDSSHPQTYYTLDEEFLNEITRSMRLNIENVNELIENEKSLSKARLDKQRQVVDINQIELKYKRDMESLQSKLEKATEDYELKIRELERILASKTDIIGNLSAKVKTLTSNLESYYSDADVEEFDSVNVSIEEMVEYLNDYKLCLVGGRMELPSKLEELGFDNIIQVDHRRAVSSTPVVCDFFCVNTQFISHKLVKLVQERYPDMSNQMFYYNGTNVENLIRTAYFYIKDWMEGTDDET